MASESRMVKHVIMLMSLPAHFTVACSRFPCSWFFPLSKIDSAGLFGEGNFQRTIVWDWCPVAVLS